MLETIHRPSDNIPDIVWDKLLTCVSRRLEICQAVNKGQYPARYPYPEHHLNWLFGASDKSLNVQMKPSSKNNLSPY